MKHLVKAVVLTWGFVGLSLTIYLGILLLSLLTRDLGTVIIIYCGALLAVPIIMGWAADCLWGDPTYGHPIVAFGKLIGWGEHQFNHGRCRVAKGLVYNALLIVLVLALGLCFEPYILLPAFESWTGIDVFNTLILGGIIYHFVHTIGIFFMLSGTTLVREVQGVFDALERGLDEGRRQVARIVGRDTGALSEHEVKTAALETLSENLSDGVVAPMFWYALLGLPGLLAYKMINTQDSMIGYRNARYKDYGCFSARLDDVANYIPARLTALLMILTSGRPRLMKFVWKYGRQHASPNSGYPEAALAGILGCRFGGPHDYFGQTVYKPFIGEQERPLSSADAIHAIRINRRVERIMLIFVLIVRLAIGLATLPILTH